MSPVHLPTTNLSPDDEGQMLIDDVLIDDLVKGIPGGVAPFLLSDIGKKGWNVLREDMPLPLAVLKVSALESNQRWMKELLATYGALHAPHGKTSASPQIYKMQLDDGAWAISISNVNHLHLCRHFGFKRVLMANQLVGRQAVRSVLETLSADPDFDFYCLVDSERAVETLIDGLKAHPIGRPLNILIEIGVEGARAGCRSIAGVLALAHLIKQNEALLNLRGVEGYEGVIYGDIASERERQVTQFLDLLIESAKACVSESLFSVEPIILSAGGSGYYDLVLERLSGADLGARSMVVIRSGGYMFHDSMMYRRHFERIKERSIKAREIPGHLKPAIEIWCYVQSCPEPTRLILSAGKRDISFDNDLPLPETWYRPGLHSSPQQIDNALVCVEMHTQHIHANAPMGHPFQVGDMISLGISQPCTTFDKWKILPIVDDDYNVISGVRTYF